MGNYVNDALLDASPYRKQQDESKALVNKWDKTGLLDGLNEEFQKNGMAVMLENQARQLIQENSATGGTSNGSITRKKSINESASSKSGSTKPSPGSRKVITEEQQVANRFKKLAGLIK